jgi:lysozyme
MVNALRTSDKGVAFFLVEEAVVNVAYHDGKNFAIGVGHNSPHIKGSDRLTLAASVALLREDLAKTWEPLVNKMIKVPLKQHEFDALVSNAYNRGPVAFKHVADRLNAGDRDGAMAELLHDPNANRHGRRLRERSIFLSADYGDVSVFKVYDANPRKSRPRVVVTSTVIPSLA